MTTELERISQSSGWFMHNYILIQQQFSHPAWEWRPGRNTVTQVPHDPDHDNGRIQVVDFGLETQTKAGSVRGAATSNITSTLCSLRFHKKAPKKIAQKGQNDWAII